MICSKLLYAVYLDELLINADLMRNQVLAYADDLVFILRDSQEISSVINKLESLHPFAQLNKAKCSILEVGSQRVSNGEQHGVKVVTSYKYLGVEISSQTQSTVTGMKNRIAKLLAQVAHHVKRLDFEVRKLVLDTFVKAVVTY